MPKKKLKKLTGKEDSLDGQDDKVGIVVLIFFLIICPCSREEHELFSSFVMEG